MVLFQGGLNCGAIRVCQISCVRPADAGDSSTIDLRLALFPRAPFRSIKAAVKMHTLLDLRGSIPSFIHVSDGKLHDVNVLDLLIPEPTAIYIMDRAYVDFERLFVFHQAGAPRAVTTL